ncbi:hypothetical protein V7114_20845 [Neobacillus niacini]|uniref:hypothetical protein n=1 Tax=Neobacillus niacini TaxID=86668 RepID=UPI002FFD5C53
MQRPKISQTVIDLFTNIIDSQDGKGFEKYEVSIDDAKDESYNWLLMALEEAADLPKYLVKEIRKLEINNQFLLKELLAANETIRELKLKSTYYRYEKLERENLAMAQEIAQLKDDKDLYQKLFVKKQLEE